MLSTLESPNAVNVNTLISNYLWVKTIRQHRFQQRWWNLCYMSYRINNTLVVLVIMFVGLVGWLVVLSIYLTLAVFQPYRDLEAGDKQSLKFKWRGRESNPGPLALQAKSLTTWQPPLPHVRRHFPICLLFSCKLDNSRHVPNSMKKHYMLKYI